MGLKLVRDEERFVFETGQEKDDLEDARRYFGDAPALMINGLGYNISKETAGDYFNRIKRGKHPTHKTSSVSVEDWRKILYYAFKYIEGEKYKPKKFVRPEL